MSDIFISYAREDIATARWLAEALEDHGWSAFWDRRIPPGVPWSSYIEGQLEQANCVVVIWSESSVESDYVQEEAEEGGAKALIPVLLGAVRPPFGFRRLHAADLTGWDGEGTTPELRQLIADIEARIGAPAVAGGGSEQPATEKGRSKKKTAKRPTGGGQSRKGTQRSKNKAAEGDAGAGDVLAPLTVFRDRLKDGSEGPEMVVLPAGEFLMGSPVWEERYNEKPQHRVRIARPFAAGRYPVTFDEYDRFAAATGRRQPGDSGWGRLRRPVVDVSWKDAKAYVAWLAGQTGKPYRLLSEAEWEYACRAGTTTRYSFGDKITTEDANFDENIGKTTEVGSYPANPWKLCDMHGNVHEWVEDVWHDSYDGAPGDGSAWTKGGISLENVNRGGSWVSSPEIGIPSAWRYGARDCWSRSDRIGFRIARTLSP